MSRPGPLAELLWAVRFRFNNRFRRRLAVLKCDVPVSGPDRGVTVRRFGPGEDLPDELRAGLAGLFGADFPAVHAAERAGGSVLYVGLLENEPAGFVRAKPGGRVAGWHEDLGPDDRLIYAMGTARAARGRGVAAAVLRAALADLPAGAAAWADTMTWNAPCLTVLGRAGFRTLYEADPLPAHPD